MASTQKEHKPEVLAENKSAIPNTNVQQHSEELELPLKMKLKKAAFGFPPAADIAELEAKLKERNEFKAEKLKKLDETADSESPKESDGSKNAKETGGLKDDKLNVTQNLESPNAETFFLSDEAASPEKSIKSPNKPVAFAMQPEKDFTKPLDKLDPDMKFYFGSSEKLSPNSLRRQIEKESPPSLAYQINDISQSVTELVDKVHETAEMLLVDTEKMLEQMDTMQDTHEDMYAMPHQVIRYEVHLPQIKEVQDTTSVSASEPEQEIEEELAEILENPEEEINEKIFDSNRESKTFNPIKLSKLNDFMMLEYEPEIGSLRFEKRNSLQLQEKEMKIQNQDEDEPTVQDQKQRQQASNTEPEKSLNVEWMSLRNDRDSSVERENVQPKNTKLRRSEAAEDLSVLGATPEKSCECATKQMKRKSPPALNFNVTNAKAGSDKMRDSKSGNTSKKVVSDVPKKIPQKTSTALTKTEIVQNPKLASVATTSSLHQMVQPGKPTVVEMHKQKKNKKTDDDDGFINLVRTHFCN